MSREVASVFLHNNVKIWVITGFRNPNLLKRLAVSQAGGTHLPL